MARKKKVLDADISSKSRNLGDLVSIGPAALADFKLLEIDSVKKLRNKNARVLYDRLCDRSGVRHDPCVEDVFRFAIEQANNPKIEKQKANWFYWSKIRKQKNL